MPGTAMCQAFLKLCLGGKRGDCMNGRTASAPMITTAKIWNTDCQGIDCSRYSATGAPNT